MRSSMCSSKMRDLSEDDLRPGIAGNSWWLPKISGIQWGGGKDLFSEACP